MVGRKDELLALDRALRADESQFVAVYGRRRVGKTYLVREALGREFIFEHVGPYDGSYEEMTMPTNSSGRWLRSLNGLSSGRDLPLSGFVWRMCGRSSPP